MMIRGDMPNIFYKVKNSYDPFLRKGKCSTKMGKEKPREMDETFYFSFENN